MVISPCSICFDFHPINTTTHLKSPKCYKNTEYFHCSFRSISLQKKIFWAYRRRGILRSLVDFLPNSLFYYLTLHIISNSPRKKWNYIMFSKMSEMLWNGWQFKARFCLQARSRGIRLPLKPRLSGCTRFHLNAV